MSLDTPANVDAIHLAYRLYVHMIDSRAIEDDIDRCTYELHANNASANEAAIQGKKRPSLLLSRVVAGQHLRYIWSRRTPLSLRKDITLHHIGSCANDSSATLSCFHACIYFDQINV